MISFVLMDNGLDNVQMDLPLSNGGLAKATLEKKLCCKTFSSICYKQAQVWKYGFCSLWPKVIVKAWMKYFASLNLQKLPFNSTLESLQSFSKVIVWLYNRHIPNRCNSADCQTRHGSEVALVQLLSHDSVDNLQSCTGLVCVYYILTMLSILFSSFY